MTRTVAGLGLHPVKSTAIRSVPRTRVGLEGFVGDRRWMVVDEAGALVSARELRTLFTVVADTVVTDPDVATALRLRAPGMPDLEVDEPETPLVDVVMFGSKHLRGRPVPAEAGAWLGQATGRPGLRLVWCDDPSRRSLSPKHSRPGDHTGFADGYPVTLASLASLGRLNDWIAEAALERGEVPPGPLPIGRFRPNVVIDGEIPFEEDAWTRVQIGEVPFRLAKPVDRCVMTTISAVDLTSTAEPIRTLARHRRWDGATWFAVHLIPEGTGVISVGDAVVPQT